MATRRPATLVLADGSVFRGYSVGAVGEGGGEVVFNTSMSGYQEILTDPSYCGQIVVMTFPLMGNYGISLEDTESSRPWVEGFVVKELAPLASSYRSVGSLEEFLCRHGVVGLAGIDTRALTRRVRLAGALKGLISGAEAGDEILLERLRGVPDLEGRDLVREVTRGRRTREWPEHPATPGGDTPPAGGAAGLTLHVVVLDYGCKTNVLRALAARGCRITVMPARSLAAQVLEQNPDGVLLSNGPGDPRVLQYAIETVRDLLGRVPIFGICLGHQLLAASLGARIYKLRFGHHGANHPVQDLDTGHVAITVQNHGFAVDRESLQQKGGRVTHMNLNDQTVAGMALPEQRAFSVQFHPEAAPGPHDSLSLFNRFCSLMRNAKEAPWA